MDSDRRRRVEQVFHRAAELAAEERAAYLAEVCGGDDDLREEVERLLEAAADTPGSSLEPPKDTSAVHSVSVGQKLGHYRVTGRLGAGGMGEVWEADDTKLKRRVALKVLPPHMATSPERLERFQREAETLATLDHPNIVSIHAVEEVDGVPFLAMQLVEGQTLSELIPAGGMPIDRILDIAIPLADAVAAAHENDVIHRDLKPGNVMLTEKGRVKVLDFGLAKAPPQPAQITATELPTEPLTQVGTVVGTVPYMSPEQLDGREVDSRSDVFSLGVVLYEMATGRRPFQGANSASLVSSILRDAPTEVGVLRKDLPRDLARIVRRCLEKDPERRFQTAKDIHNEFVDLRRELESVSRPVVEVAVAPETAPNRRRPGWPLVALGGLAAVVALIAVLVFVGREPEPGASVSEEAVSEATERPRIVVLPFENLGPPEDEHFAAGITEEITSRLAMVRGLQVISRNSAVQYAATGKTTRQIGDELRVQYLLEGTVRWASAAEAVSRVRITPQLIQVADDSHLWAQSYDRVVDDIFAIQSEIAAQVVERLDVTLLEQDREAVQARPTDNLEAYQAYLQATGVRIAGTTYCQRMEERSKYLERAVELDPTFALAWARQAQGQSIYYVSCTGGSERSVARAREALTRAEELAPDSWEVIKAKIRIAQRIDRDYERALEYLQAADVRVINDADFVMTRGTVLRRKGLWSEAIADFKRASDLDPRSVGAPIRIASAYTYLRRYPEADEYFERTIAVDPDFPFAYQRKAWNYWLWRGDLPAARLALERYPEEPGPLIHWAWFWQLIYEGNIHAALERLQAFPGEWIDNELDTCPKALLTAQAWDLLGEDDRAQTAYMEAWQLLEEQIPESGANAKLLRALGLTLAGLGLAEEAIGYSQQSVARYPIAADPYFGSTDLLRQALIYTRLHRIDEALEIIEQLLSMPSMMSVAMLQLDPRWQPLHQHPRYRVLLNNYEQEDT